MPSLSFGAPVLPGKSNVGRELAKVSMGEKHKEYVESRTSLGIVRETIALYATPQGEAVAVYLEANDPVWSRRKSTMASALMPTGSRANSVEEIIAATCGERQIAR